MPTSARAAAKSDEAKVEVLASDEGPADEKLVDETVVWIRERLAATVYKGATSRPDVITAAGDIGPFGTSVNLPQFGTVRAPGQLPAAVVSPSRPKGAQEDRYGRSDSR